MRVSVLPPTTRVSSRRRLRLWRRFIALWLLLLDRWVSLPVPVILNVLAARRFVFELSWRFAGARTYSASGWAGRMFYRES
jgi:hypothetical protein